MGWIIEAIHGHQLMALKTLKEFFNCEPISMRSRRRFDTLANASHVKSLKLPWHIAVTPQYNKIGRA